jgi:FkbM family methyltransferase
MTMMMNVEELAHIADAVSFHDFLIRTAITSIRQNHFQDNFDAERFNRNGRDASQSFHVNWIAPHYRWLSDSRSQLFEAFQILEDRTSRNLFASLLIYRLAGHLCFRIPAEFQDRPAHQVAYQKIEKSGKTDSMIPVSGRWGKLAHYDFWFDRNHYIVDCHGLEPYLFRRQYFFERDGIRVMPMPGDHVVDGGGCLGDATCVFSNAVGPGGKVFVFDPLDIHIEVLRHNARQFPHPNVEVMPFALTDRVAPSPPCKGTDYDPGFSIDSGDGPQRSLDDCIETRDLDRVDFIKLDIEGSELAAIRGAARTINTFRPRLAISIYHRPNDLHEIALYIRKHHAFYRLFLGHYTIHSEETILYGLPD